jgi:poly(3-hydroxybutyrate) depolymerase
MTVPKSVWCSIALLLGSIALPACSTPDTLLDQVAAQSEFGPQIAARASNDGGTTAVPLTTPTPSKGCGHPPPGDQTLGKFSQYTTHVTGMTLDPTYTVPAHDRNYFVWLPLDYDSSKPYRVTFQFMGCGDRNGAATANYKLFAKDPESIYVAMNMPPAGFPPANKDCFDNTVGKTSIEWEFMGLTASKVEQDFCIDESRVFVSGYSSGAWVSNMFGCYFAGKDPNRMFGPDISVRGQASVTGGPVQPDVPCGGAVAALWIHDSDDKENPIGGNQATSLPNVLKRNGCTGSATEPWGSTTSLSSVCKRYTSCPAEFPVVWCPTAGKGHSAQDDLALPGFLEFESVLDPK